MPSPRACLTTLSVLLCLTHAGDVAAARFRRASPIVTPPLTTFDIPYRKFVLPNGLRLIVHEDHQTPIVAVDIWYHVGSKNEQPGHTGFAHLFEHLMFTSSENHPDEYFRPLLDAGATHINGNTWLDRTTYFENVPVNALDLALWIESDRMGHLLGAIDQKKLDEQRGVVENEKRQTESRPYGKVDEYLAVNTYPYGHPYSWTTLGSMNDLDAASLDDVKSWFRQFYGAANAVLVVAGDVEPVKIRDAVARYFGDIPPGPALTRTTSWVARQTGHKRAVLADQVPQARLYKVWNVPGYATRDFTLLQLAADLLAGDKNSRLYRRLVYRDQTATAVEVSLGPFEIGSQFKIVVTLKAGSDPAQVERALDEEMADLLKNGPAREELALIRAAIYSSFVRRLERIDGEGGKASVLAESELYGGSPDFYKQALRSVEEASPDDVRAAVRDWLSDGDFVLTVLPQPDFHAAAHGVDRSRLPAVGAPSTLNLPPLQRMKLSNGLEVVLAERHGAPLVQLMTIVDAGHAADRLARPGTSNLALAMLTEGTRTKDALVISALQELLGAEIDAGSTLDTSYIALSALSSRLPESIDLYADVLLNPTFPERQLDKLKGQTVAQIDQQESQPNGIASRLFPRLLYGQSHAYANPFSGIGSKAGVQATSAQDLREFYGRWVRPDNAVLLAVGDTSLARLGALLERALGHWRAPAEPLPVKQIGTVALASAPRIFLVDRPAAEQSLVLAAGLAPPRSDPDSIAFESVNSLFGGSFVSRLNLDLREDKHWSYGVSSSLVKAKGQRPWVTSAMVQTDRTADAMREISKQLRDLAGGRPPAPAEIQFARDTLVQSLAGRNETDEEVARSYADILTFGLPDTYLSEYATRLESLTPPEVAAAAVRLVHPEAMTWIVVGDLAAIEQPVRALGWGQVQVLDSEGHVLR